MVPVLFYNRFYLNKTETIFPRLERQLDQTTKILAKILFTSTLRCKTGTWWTSYQTMKVLGRALFMCTLRCKTGTLTK